jgi:hypothetical protein
MLRVLNVTVNKFHAPRARKEATNSRRYAGENDWAGRKSCGNSDKKSGDLHLLRTHLAKRVREIRDGRGIRA